MKINPKWLKDNLFHGSGHGHICHPNQLAELNRRELLKTGVSLSAFALASQVMNVPEAIAQSGRYPPQRRLVWINMSGGWDILEVTDPKLASTSGIDMMYDWGLAQTLAGTGGNDRIGRWFTRLAAHGQDVLVVRGLGMGTTSHMAGSVYMDTGILSNSGNVNSASIPAIVASESQATIPIIQLNGGSEPKIDRGLLSPVSAVRAQNLELYRSMYPQSADELSQKLAILDHLKTSVTRVQAKTGTYDRLNAVSSAEQKIRVQFQNNVGEKLALTAADRAPFLVNAPRTMNNNGQVDAFALSYKLLTNNLVTCLNLGVGGFDTHANQERQLQPTLDTFDHLLSAFISQLRAANQLDNTLIVIYSDFGRTPKVNGSNGRDHWPVGGALMIGGGISGGRFVGKTDDNLRTIKINSSTGLEDSNGIDFNPTHLGGSILDLTLGTSYLSYRTYLESIPALTRLKGA